MGSKPKAYSYIRMSTRRQLAADRDSLRRQTVLRDAYLAKKSLTLDDSISFHDFGVSAFRGKNASTGNLAKFIQFVEEGRIPKGSFLIIEKIDRFGRDDAYESLGIFTDLIEAGIIIVTLDPEKEWDKEAIKAWGLMELVMRFVLANQESVNKSNNCGAAWVKKKAQAAKKLVTKMTPSWLEVVDGKIEVIPERMAIIQRIFTLASKSHGSSQIASLLNREGVPGLGRMKDGTREENGWFGSSVNKLLRSRTVLGEYQPHRTTPEGPTRRVPVGEAIKGYYPAIIDKQLFDEVQKKMNGRKFARGKCGRNVSNLFQGIIRDARDGGLVKTKIMRQPAYLVPVAASRGMPGAKWSFDYSTFEQTVLTFLREITPDDLAPKRSKTDDGSIDRLAEVERRIEILKKKIAGDGDIEPLLDVLDRLQGEQKSLIKLINDAKAPETQRDDLRNAQSTVNMLEKATGEDRIDLRARLKSTIRSIIDSIWILVEPWGDGRVCFAQIEFRGGGCRLIHLYSSGKGIKKIDGNALTFAIGNRHQFPGVGPMLDLRQYAKWDLVRESYSDMAERLNQGHPRTIALSRIAAGETPFAVCKDMGIARNTIYHWVHRAAGTLRPRKQYRKTKTA